MASITEYTATLAKLNSIPTQDIESSTAIRKQALALSRKLAETLESPVNRATDLIFAPYVTIAARLAVDLHLFEFLCTHSDPLTTPELATLSGAEELLVLRLLRLLAASSYLTEVSANLWAANAATHAIALPGISAGHRLIFDLTMTPAITSPRYLREVGYVSPSEPRDGLVQYAYQTKLSSFDFLVSRPQLLADFNDFMGNTMGDRRYWYDWFPVEEQLLEGFDAAVGPLLVDVAGGKGHDVQAFHEKFPGRGRLILQDLEQALGGIPEGTLDPVIERAEYDFFTEQPVQGARAYFFHHILHDWSDKYALMILEKLKGAMKPGYSKLLVHDLVLPNEGATAYQCIWDMNMMCFNAAIERSEKQWTDLLTRAGFEIVKIWVDDPEADGLVEAMVKA